MTSKFSRDSCLKEGCEAKPQRMDDVILSNVDKEVQLGRCKLFCSSECCHNYMRNERCVVCKRTGAAYIFKTKSGMVHICGAGACKLAWKGATDAEAACLAAGYCRNQVCSALLSGQTMSGESDTMRFGVCSEECCMMNDKLVTLMNTIRKTKEKKLYGGFCIHDGHTFDEVVRGIGGKLPPCLTSITTRYPSAGIHNYCEFNAYVDFVMGDVEANTSVTAAVCTGRCDGNMCNPLMTLCAECASFETLSHTKMPYGLGSRDSPNLWELTTKQRMTYKQFFQTQPFYVRRILGRHELCHSRVLKEFVQYCVTIDPKLHKCERKHCDECGLPVNPIEFPNRYGDMQWWTPKCCRDCYKSSQDGNHKKRRFM